MLEADIGKNDGKIDQTTQEINKNKKTIRGRRQKARKNVEISLRVIELRNLKTEIKNTVDALK